MIRRAAVALAILVLVAGCSDDSGDDTAAQTTTTDAPTTTTAPAASSRSLEITVEPAPGLPGYNLYRPTDVGATGAPLPVITWANGGCVRHDATWAPLLERWAEAGYFVIAITTPPDGSDPTAATSADDQALAIDWATSQNEDSPFVGQLDLDRVVAAGNSCGGITSLALAAADPRVASVFILSGSSAGPGASREAASAVMSRVTVPVGFAVGAEGQDIANAPAHLDYDVLPDGVPGYLASRAEGDHPTVSTDEGILDEVADISVNWIDWSLYGNADLIPELEHPPAPWTATAKNL